MMQRVVRQAVESYRYTGRAQWPQSVQRVLEDRAKIEHDPTLLNEGGVEQVIRQGKALARHLTETGVQKQRESDMKKVTLDWAGH